MRTAPEAADAVPRADTPPSTAKRPGHRTAAPDVSVCRSQHFAADGPHFEGCTKGTGLFGEEVVAYVENRRFYANMDSHEVAEDNLDPVRRGCDLARAGARAGGRFGGRAVRSLGHHALRLVCESVDGDAVGAVGVSRRADCSRQHARPPVLQCDVRLKRLAYDARARAVTLRSYRGKSDSGVARRESHVGT
jgi:hypothetical protein